MKILILSSSCLTKQSFGGIMNVNLKEDIESYQKTQDTFALLNLIKIAENDIKNGKTRKADDVFSDLRQKIAENG